MGQQYALFVGIPRKGWWFWRAPAIDSMGHVHWWGARSRSSSGAEVWTAFEIRRRAFLAAE